MEIFNINDSQSKNDILELLSEYPSIDLYKGRIDILSGEYKGTSFIIDDKYKEVMIKADEIDREHLIFGKDNTKNIVAIEVVNDSETVIIFKDGEIKKIPYINWLLTNKQIKPNSKRMKGNNFFKYMTIFPDTKSLFEAKKKLRYKEVPYWLCLNKIESTMIYNGLTLFKGMSVSQTSVLSFDIETDGILHTKKSTIYLITNTFKKNGEIIKKHFRLDNYDNPGDLIEDWCEWVKDIDPDIINGHNILMYDFPYLLHVAKLYKIRILLGRNDSPIIFARNESNYRVDGAQVWKYKKVHIFGRHIVDGMFLAVKYDFGRKYPSWGLKAIAEFEGLVKKDRQFYDASKINENWHIPEEREKIIKYGIDDSDDSLALYELMVNPYFYFCKSLPRSFEMMMVSATGAWLNSLLCRAYLQKGHSLPKPSEPKKVSGGISYANPGIYSNVIKLDVASEYPSIILQYKVYSKNKDPFMYYYKTTKYFTEERFANKRKFKETGDSLYDDIQAAQKIGINSLYGLTSTRGLNFNDFDIGNYITRKGRQVIRNSIRLMTGKTLKEWQPDYDEEKDIPDYMEELYEK